MSEREIERLEASVKPMQLVLTKVSDSSTDFGKKTHRINRLIVEKAVLQPNPLDNDSSAPMARDRQGNEARAKKHATRCGYPVELVVRYVEFCPQLSVGNRYGDK
jgi:hypothetical protein